MGSKITDRLTRFDRLCRQRFAVRLLGGVDEAGRGALAGPVVAACVVLEPGTPLPGVNDSKCMSHEQREALVPVILRRAAAWGVGWATAAEIDRINILQATLLAARRAIAVLGAAPEFLLTDYLKLIEPPCPCRPIVDGDAKSQAIAAASVLAKVARDRIMTALAGEYPQYNFAGHKGYGTPEHQAAINAHGPSTLHRLSYRGVCFFDAEPAIRARRRDELVTFMLDFPTLGGPVGWPPTPDWLAVLTATPGDLDPRAFLPECEWAPAPAPAAPPD
jgi:ribonuclease HII